MEARLVSHVSEIAHTSAAWNLGQSDDAMHFAIFVAFRSSRQAADADISTVSVSTNDVIFVYGKCTDVYCTPPLWTQITRHQS